MGNQPGLVHIWGQKHLPPDVPTDASSRRDLLGAATSISFSAAALPSTGVAYEGHMPWRVRAGTMALTSHSCLPHILGEDPQKPGVQLLASSQRSNGCPPRMGSSQPMWDSAPASGQDGSSGLAPARRPGTAGVT